MKNTLSVNKEIRIKFNEVDPLGVVWHGHYITYFEEGREEFGAKYGLRYLDIYNHGFVVPVVSIGCDYRRPIHYGDSIIVETTFFNSPAAKLNFGYKIFNSESMELIAEGKSLQVFLDKNSRQLELTTPEFFRNWKSKLDMGA